LSASAEPCSGKWLKPDDLQDKLCETPSLTPLKGFPAPIFDGSVKSVKRDLTMKPKPTESRLKQFFASACHTPRFQVGGLYAA
jgi:hypothetical protein